MTVQLGRTRLRVHPLMLMFPVMASRLGMGGDAAALLISLAVHEAAHLLAARALGIGVSELRLMPFGGSLALENPYALPPSRLFAVSAAGPASNLLALLSGAALAHWRLLSPDFALALLRTNLVLMLFNLLPALPLDGGRMLYALLFPRLGRPRAARLGVALGRVAAGLLLAFAAWAWLVQGRLNLSPAFAAVFLLASGRDELSALSSAKVSALLDALRPVSEPVEARLWAIGDDCSLQSALRCAEPGAATLFAVYHGNRLLRFTDDRALLEAALRQDGDAGVAAAVS
ncbi:MAG: hypothetical protein Q4C10_02895 [Clostridia bacterium]|nr:hypothetical protein [Clostridia bacterium]